MNVDKPEFVLNPHGESPLTAELYMRSTDNVSVTYEIIKKGTNDVVDVRKIGKEFRKEYINDTNTATPIIGLYEDYPNLVRVSIINESGTECFKNTYSAKTPKIDTMPEAIRPEIRVIKKERMEPGWNTLYVMTIHKTASFDRDGNLRWVLLNGAQTVNVTENTLIVQAFGVSYANLYSITGKKLDTYEFPDYKTHHDFCLLPNGNIIFAVDKIGEQTVEDYLIEYDPKEKRVIKEYNLNEYLNIGRTTFINDVRDWLHVNSTFYDASDDTLVMSGRNQGVVFKIKREDGSLKWIISPHKDWHNNIATKPTIPYLLKPLDKNGIPIADLEVIEGTKASDDFEWNFGQHHAQVLESGEILMYDNGDNRFFKGAGIRLDSYSRIVKYKIDETNMTISQAWSYGKERNMSKGDETAYSQIMSSAQELPLTGNMTMGSVYIRQNNKFSSLLIEVDPKNNDEVVYEATFGGTHGVYRILRTTYFDYYEGFGSN